MKQAKTIRRVDKIHEAKTELQPTVAPKIEIWERSWLACANVLMMYNGLHLKEYHVLVEKWIPIINKAHNFPISKLMDFIPVFIYLDKPNPMKEILAIYFELQSNQGNKLMYIVFNVPLFKKLCRLYISIRSKSNQINHDLDRGVINLTNFNFLNIHAADYFKASTSWYLLFIAVNHALTHIESFEKYDTASYSDHSYARKSAFFKLYFYGRIEHTMS